MKFDLLIARKTKLIYIDRKKLIIKKRRRSLKVFGRFATLFESCLNLKGSSKKDKKKRGGAREIRNLDERERERETKANVWLIFEL